MGSFNTTCIASGQTIAPRDKCYLLPIRQAHDYTPVEMTVNGKPHSAYGITSFNGYPQGFWEPAGDFIEASYDDCFQFDIARTPRNGARLLQLLMTLARETPVVAAGENPIHDVAFDMRDFIEATLPLLRARLEAKKPADISYTKEQRDALFQELFDGWDYVLEAANEHRLFLMSRGEPFALQFAVVHSAAYDQLIALTTQCKGWNNESWDQRSHFNRALARSNVELVDELRQELAAAEAAGNEDEVRMLKAVHRMSRQSGFREELQHAGSCGSLHFPGEAQSLNQYIADYIDGKLDEESLFQAVKPFLDTRYVMQGLYLLNQKLMPMSYCSQDYSNVIGDRYADFVRATADVVNQGRRDHYGDDEDEEDEEDDAGDARQSEFDKHFD